MVRGHVPHGEAKEEDGREEVGEVVDRLVLQLAPEVGDLPNTQGVNRRRTRATIRPVPLTDCDDTVPRKGAGRCRGTEWYRGTCLIKKSNPP